MHLPDFLRGEWPSAANFTAPHPVFEIVRSLLVSSALWALLAVALYGVYTMVAGAS